MAGSSRWLPVIGIIGLACLGVGVYSVTQNYTKTAKPVNTSKQLVVNAGLVTPQINISFTSFDPSHTKFSHFGPVIAKTRNGVRYLSMSRYGTLAYTVHLKELPKGEDDTIWISVTLSSELPENQERSDPEKKHGSRVTLFVNGKSSYNAATQTTVADRGKIGDGMTWIVDANLFHTGNNLLEFQVPNGAYGNGLAVWEDILVELPKMAVQ